MSETAYNLLVCVVYALAVMRIVRLINGDTILDPIRLRIIERAQRHRDLAEEARRHGQLDREGYEHDRMSRWNKVVYFVGCPWCVSMWVALFTAWVPMWHAHNRIAIYIGVVLAVSHLVGVFARFADTEEIEVVGDDE
ncbi:hypothetical protein PBI_THONKO_6 [Mycobacterium phage Thonko]|uniref:Uncharacterized protein n=1 Tax=Mycobacterium phage Thonko TaxID=2282910 RepID=A0A346FC53_9CAUD|nr:hypothetical protein I5G57_gp006 [Mycobacterium phage Thonko]AXN53278.1 hypothetical protein PBI_THONKO_6 [Mycobacterium phage Thonko]